MLFLGFLRGCSGIVLTSNPLMMVVERNKSTIPAWTRLEEGKFYPDSDKYRFLFVKQGIDHLTLGIKQAQLEALAASQRALYQMVRDELRKEYASAAAWQPTGSLQQKLVEELEGFHHKYAKVADIYYERRADTAGMSEDHYDAYFLVFIGQEPLRLFMVRLQRELR